MNTTEPVRPAKPRRVDRRSIELMVRKAWTLFIRWEETQHDIDYNIYLQQREFAERAIAAGHPSWKDDFPLP